MSSSRCSVRLLPIAEEDLLDIVSYVAADDVGAALSLADRFEKNLLKLSSFPFLGRTPNDAKLTRLGYRFLVVGSYLIFYKVRGKTALVHRIIHGARDLENLSFEER